MTLQGEGFRLSRWLVRLTALTFLGVFVALPLWAVFSEAFSKGVSAYFDALARPETRAAIKLTLTTVAVALPFNTIFGLAAAWLIAKYRFPGKGLLITLVDLPFSVSPVVAGLMFVLLFGARGVLGPWLEDHGWHILFAKPAIILATTFVTFPFVAREVLPVMQEAGSDEEEAALTLGVSGWRLFFRVTLPKIKWGVLYGVVLCNARAMGEFGAVSVVSGHIRGETTTLPLEVEMRYNEYDLSGAFAVASLLVALALVTLIAKRVLSTKVQQPR